MPQKQNPSSRRKNKDCLTLTADATDLLKALNLSNNQTAWKSRTNKLAKTVNKHEAAMTEDDLDRLFNNAAGALAKGTGSNKKRVRGNQPKGNKNQFVKKGVKVKTEARIEPGWTHEMAQFGDTFKSSQPAIRYKNHANTVKFLQVDDEWDKLLTGLPSNLTTQQQNADEKQMDQDRIGQLFGSMSSKEQRDSKEPDLTQEFKKNYLVGKIVGEGAYASVRVAIHKPTNQKIAIKVYEKSKIKDPQRKKSVRREIKILQILNHPNIVKIFVVVETNHHLNIILEYLSGISLNVYLKSLPSHKASESNCKKIIRPLIEALRHLHERNIAHRDIKLENIILEDNLSPKLIDFGFSTCIESNKKVKIFCGTPSYMAPQIVQKKQYRGQPADIWAMGVMFFVSLTGIFPFKGSTDQQLYKKIMNAEYPKLQIPSKDTADLIGKMLRVNPQERITASQILNHPWMRSTETAPQGAQGELGSATNPTRIVKNRLNNTNNLNYAHKKMEASLERKKITTVSSHKSKEEGWKPSNNPKKLAETYKENLKMQLRLAKQSPCHKLNMSNTNIRKETPLGTNNNYVNANPASNSNNKFMKTQKIGMLSSSKKDNCGKAHTKVLDLLRMEMKKRQDEKSRGKNCRI